MYIYLYIYIYYIYICFIVLYIANVFLLYNQSFTCKILRTGEPYLFIS